jgi:bla regulator protein blaR1
MMEQQLRHGKWLLAMLLVAMLILGWWLPLAASAQAAAVAQAPAAVPGQDASAALPAFEVVSIKPDKSGSRMLQVTLTSDGISVSGFPAHMLLREALGVSDDQLLGEPGWLNSEHFNIEAKVAAEDLPRLKALTPTQRWAMLLPVFEDRFALKFHHESKVLTQYALVVARSGLKMKEATLGETYPNGLKSPDGKSGANMMRMQPGEVMGQGVPIASLTRYLSFQFHTQVIDKTGLVGKYDFDLKWAPDEMAVTMPRSPDGSGPGSGDPAPPAAAGPSIFTALEEQLGLKLEARKEPTDVIVIDHIEQPSPN